MKKHRFQNLTILITSIIIAGAIFGVRSWLLSSKDKSNADVHSVLRQSQELKSAGKIAEAEKILELALKDSADNTEISNELASVYFQDKKYDQSTELYQKLADSKPDDSVTINYLANSLRDSGKDDQAIEAYKKSLELGNLDSASNLVTMYNNKEQFDQSISLLNDLLTKYPDNESLLKLLASTYYKMGNQQEADKILASIK